MANKRPDGDGLVRKRSDGRWEGRIVVGHKCNLEKSAHIGTSEIYKDWYDFEDE